MRAQDMCHFMFQRVPEKRKLSRQLSNPKSLRRSSHHDASLKWKSCALLPWLRLIAAARDLLFFYFTYFGRSVKAAAGRFFMSSAAIAMASTTFLAAVFGLASSLVAALGSFSSSIKLGNFRLRRFFGRKAREQ